MNPKTLILSSFLVALIPAASTADETVLFGRDIAPIFAANCYQCHGPDRSQRASDFRLDVKEIATGKLSSGNRSIQAGDIQASELFQRLIAADDSRMPPADSDRRPTKSQIDRIRIWIEQGARWDTHWSFQRLKPVRLPEVRNNNWSENSIDRFILARLEEQNLNPTSRADHHDLIRRLFVDVTGLLPEIEMERELSKQRYTRLVDHLLASPRFGERWSRRWLDVARYADSNGADENHYYPHAFHYRDWVIEAFNSDLTYDQFVTHQIAGDFLANDQDPTPLIGTGFLAIGLKILAEQDPRKKQMDMIDEQLDALGQSFLGLTIACARCHDHKFDPISAKDYYAMAGILYSSSVGDQPLKDRDFLKRSAAAEKTISDLERQIVVAESDLETSLDEGGLIKRQAESFDRGNVIIDHENYGKGIGIISDPGGQDNFAEFDLVVDKAAKYTLQLRYAARQARPGRILLNGSVVVEPALKQTTGSWMPDSQKWFTEGKLDLAKGKNVLRIESKPLMSHIDQIRLIKSSTTNPLDATLQKIQRLQKDLKLARASKPKPRMVMAVTDSTIEDIPLHIRGSHLELGKPVPRGFLERFGKAVSPPLSKSSGRLELSNWLTDPRSPAADVVARVIVNRIWQGYFGRGLVESPNEFGLRGSRPTHPKLLDYLANRLIENGWSLKTIHREILLSNTYQMSHQPATLSVAESDPTGSFYAFRPRRRMTPGVYRDLLLQLRGELDLQIGGPPPKVVSQNPSPEDSRKNQEVYDRSTRRSVYLPVVRSNTYDLFTTFDFPDASASTGRRPETIIPTQALLMLNGTLLKESAASIAKRLRQSGSLSAKEIYRFLFSHPPDPAEMEFLGRALGDRPSATDYELLIHTLLMSNRFLYQK